MGLNKPNNEPDNTAVRAALCRAMHLQVDAPPHILEDEIVFFSTDEMLVLAHQTGFKEVSIVSSKELTIRYFSGRTDNLKPASGEEFLLATT